MKEVINTAVLVIDDEEIVRDNIEEILVPPKRHHPAQESVRQAADILFNTPRPVLSPRNGTIPDFTVDKACNGMEGLEMVKASLAKGCPYAVIFLDMRMPGWDGLETALHIRKYDSKAEIIFVTAFSDRSIEDIVAKAGQNVGYHCKPYASEEIIQLATKAVTDYNRLRNLEKLIEVISSISLDEHQLNSLLKNILDQLVGYVDTEMAVMGKLHDDYSYDILFTVGPLKEKINIEELIARVKASNMPSEEVAQLDEVILARVDNYTIFAVLKKHENLKTEKIYLLKLFVQSAAKAIQNAELRQQLERQEKLSAVGKAVAMVIHDLRGPIKNITGLTNIVRKDKGDSEILDMLDQCGIQASEILDDFLDFIHDTDVKKEPVNICKMIEAGISMADRKADIDVVTFHKNGDIDLIVAGDESKLKRVIMNLVKNAEEVLRDKKVPNPKIDIAIDTAAVPGFVVISISDNGPGIPTEIIKTLFDPFVTKHKSGGTGLGLAIAKQYIIAHGGEISVENNNGAIFTISLPLVH